MVNSSILLHTFSHNHDNVTLPLSLILTHFSLSTVQAALCVYTFGSNHNDLERVFQGQYQKQSGLGQFSPAPNNDYPNLVRVSKFYRFMYKFVCALHCSSMHWYCCNDLTLFSSVRMVGHTVKLVPQY